MLNNFKELQVKAIQKQPKNIAVVFPHDQYVMDAIVETYKMGVIKPILIGDQYKISELIKHYNHVTIINEADPKKASRIAMDLVNNGEADIVMKGLIDSHYLLKAVVNDQYGIKDASLLSHVGLLTFPDFDRMLFVTDGAMNIAPTINEKIAIINHAVSLVQKLGDDHPKVGLVSAIEKVNKKMQSTVDAKTILEHYRNQSDLTFDIDGPFAVDNLVSMDAVLHKGITGPVAGKCNILVFPQIESGNVFYKTSVFLAHAASAGIVLGAKVPIVLTSRADTIAAKVNSIYLAVVIS